MHPCKKPCMNGAAGPVLSNGTIATTGINAPVYLIGASVTNSGVITSPGGEVVLAAGNTVEIADPGTPNITVQITAPANEAINLGSIVAPGGRLDIFGGLVRQLGAVQADTLTVGPDGAVVLGTTQPGTQAPSEAVAPALVNGSIVTPVATSGETVSTPVVPTLGTADAGSTSTTTTAPTLITGVPTLMTGVPTLITGVPTLTSSAPTLTSGTPTAPLSTIATPTSATVAPAPFEATIPLQ